MKYPNLNKLLEKRAVETPAVKALHAAGQERAKRIASGEESKPPKDKFGPVKGRPAKGEVAGQARAKNIGVSQGDSAAAAENLQGRDGNKKSTGLSPKAYVNPATDTPARKAARGARIEARRAREKEMNASFDYADYPNLKSLVEERAIKTKVGQAAHDAGRAEPSLYTTQARDVQKERSGKGPLGNRSKRMRKGAHTEVLRPRLTAKLKKEGEPLSGNKHNFLGNYSTHSMAMRDFVASTAEPKHNAGHKPQFKEGRKARRAELEAKIKAHTKPKQQ